jgi:hypothetical protein
VIAYQLENGIKIEILYAVHLNKSQSEGIFGVLIESQSGLGTRDSRIVEFAFKLFFGQSGSEG